MCYPCSRTTVTYLPGLYSSHYRERTKDLDFRVPSFHTGKLFPPEYFLHRDGQIADAKEKLLDRQSFLIVGNRRSGKTSLCNLLMDWLKERSSSHSKGRPVVCYISLERDPRAEVATFLEHTLLSMIAETVRQVFGLMFAQFQTLDDKTLADDERLRALKTIYQSVLKRSIYQNCPETKPLVPNEFVEYAKDLIDIVQSLGADNFVIFYDEANHLPRGASVEMLLQNADALSSNNFTVVLAASDEMKESFAQLQHQLGHYQVVLGPFNSPQDLVRLVSFYYFKDMSRVSDVPMTQEAITCVWRYSRGLPYQIQCLLKHSFSNTKQCGQCIVSAEHVDNAFRMVLQIWPEYFTT